MKSPKQLNKQLIAKDPFKINITFCLIKGISKQYYDSRTLRKVCGILGTIKLISGKYLVVATHREFVGVLNNQVVWRLAGHELIPFIQSSKHLSDVQVSKLIYLLRRKYILIMKNMFLKHFL